MSRRAAPSPERPATVTVDAPGRLHLGFLDPSGSLGRRFGSLGLVIEGFETAVSLSLADRDVCSGGIDVPPADVERARSSLERLREHTGLARPLHLRVERALPAHAGFGSGTQLALAVGRAFACLHGLELPTPQLAQWLLRGHRSGIGIAGFDGGGLLVDGGPRADGQPAPLLARIELPAAWRVIVVRDNALQGLAGTREAQAMAELAPMPREIAADICHQALMRVLPGAAGAEFTPFACGITKIQRRLGAHFAPAQGGSAYTSPRVGQLLQWIGEALGASEEAGDGAAIGQSSWGPTGFAILPSLDAAQAVLAAARRAELLAPGLEIDIVAARNAGAHVRLGGTAATVTTAARTSTTAAPTSAAAPARPPVALR